MDGWFPFLDIPRLIWLPIGSMVLLYMVCHGSHQYTPFILAYMPWILWILWVRVECSQLQGFCVVPELRVFARLPVWPPWSGNIRDVFWAGEAYWKSAGEMKCVDPKSPQCWHMLSLILIFVGYTVYLSILAYGCCFLNWLWFQSLLILSLAGLMSLLSAFHNEQGFPAVNPSLNKWW